MSVYSPLNVLSFLFIRFVARTMADASPSSTVLAPLLENEVSGHNNKGNDTEEDDEDNSFTFTFDPPPALEDDKDNSFTFTFDPPLTRSTPPLTPKAISSSSSTLSYAAAISNNEEERKYKGVERKNEDSESDSDSTGDDEDMLTLEEILREEPPPPLPSVSLLSSPLNHSPSSSFLSRQIRRRGEVGTESDGDGGGIQIGDLEEGRGEVPVDGEVSSEEEVK